MSYIKRIYLLLLMIISVLVISVEGQIPLPSNSGKTAKKSYQFKFSNATLDIVLQDYAEKTGRTMLKGPGLPKVMITLRSQANLSKEEYLGAIESVLGMYGIALLKEGDKFIRVVPNAKARLEAMPISPAVTVLPDGTVTNTLKDSDELVSKMIQLKNIDVSDAQKAISFMKHPYGQIQPFERINSLLVTDTKANVNRMMDIINYIDQPVEAREEPNIVPIKYAKAADIKKKLEEIIADQQAELKKKGAPRTKNTGSPGVIRPTVPGVIRARKPSANEAEILAMVERGIIRGKVKIIADERTNILIIITRPENMKFFDKIIKVLDIETQPDVGVRVFRLEYAEAKTVAGMLNDLIGATSSKKEDVSKKNSTLNKSVALRNYIAKQNAAAKKTGASKVGELSKDNIKILADERTNALVIMASRSDLKTIESIIKDMDMMLSQVLIESAIIDVKLSDNIATGVDWLQRSMIAYNNNGSERSPIMAFGGKGGGGINKTMLATKLDDVSAIAGMQYYMTFFDLNLDMVIKATASDRSAKVVSMPVVATTDNTEAKITATDKIYVFEGTTTSGSVNSYRDSRYSQQDVGLELTVTPHINEKKFVVMDIEQTMSEPGNSSGSKQDELAGKVSYSSRTLTATVAVKSGETIVLGGQVRNTSNRTVTGIPLLSRIPLLGKLFSYNSRNNGRTETIVFLTPTVLDTPEEIATETKRRHDNTEAAKAWHTGWTSSKLATPEEAAGTNSWHNGVKKRKKIKQEESGTSDDIQDPALIEFLRMQNSKNSTSVTNAEEKSEK